MDMDVSINPGPWKNEILSTGKPSYELSAMPPSCQITASRLYYSRDSLLRLSYYPKSVIETHIFEDLKRSGLFTYRGKRGGGRKTKTACKIMFHRKLLEQDWNHVNDNFDLDTAVNSLHSTLEKLMNECFPRKSIRMSSRDPPWMSPLVKSLLKKKKTRSRKGGGRDLTGTGGEDRTNNNWKSPSFSVWKTLFASLVEESWATVHA